MSIPTESYEEIFEQYSAAMMWMAELGINLSSGRTSRYEDVVGYWKDSYGAATEDEGRRVFPAFHSFANPSSLPLLLPRQLFGTNYFSPSN